MKNLFKGNKISLVTCGVLLSSSMVFGADSIDSAFKEGKVSGSLNVYNETYSDGQDKGFTSGDIELGFETASYMGVTGKVGFVGAHIFDEKNDGDSDSLFSSKAIMSEANLSYATDGFSLTVGRQAIGLEWMGDYHEAVVAAITAVPDTTIVLGYSDKVAVAGVDEIADFAKVNGKKGAYVVDVKYAGLEGFEFNPYFYSLPDVADSYGLKATYSSDMFGAVAHYAEADVDSVSNDDSILHLEGSTSIAGLSLALGYIKTDKDAGADNIGAKDDNISPFEEGNKVYEVDARTTYGSIGYEIAGVSLGALYGETKYSSSKEKELNLMLDYSFTDSLSLSALYADITAESSADDYNKFLATVSYSF